MRILLICAVLAIGVTSASDLRSRLNEVKSARPKRFLLDDGLTSSQQSQIENGFKVANHLADKLNKFDFAGVTGSVVSSVSSFLGGLSPFVGLALSLLGGNSPELQLLQRLFTEVENRFDQIDVQFAQLRRQVAFVTTQIHFTDLESNINAVQTALVSLSKVKTSAGYNYEKKEFKKTYDRTYESSGIKLFNGIVHGGLVTGGIFHEYMLYSSSDRKETRHFMIGALNLLIRAASLEITYAELNNDPNTATKRTDWVTRFAQIKSKMTAIDKEIVKNYHNQMVQDVNDFASKHPKGTLSNTDFSKQLYDKLTQKYYWRDWLVIAGKVMSTQRKENHACELNQYDNHGRSIVVASVDKTKKPIDHQATYNTLHAMNTYLRSHGQVPCGYAHGGYVHLPESARTHCDPYAAAGVICGMSYVDSHTNAAPGRYVEYKLYIGNLAYMFG